MVEQYIADNNALGFKQRVNIFRKGFAFRSATHMLPSTVAARNDLIKFYKVNPNKAFIFPNALSDTPLRNKSNNYKIGFLGRLDQSKGVDILINAFHKVVKKNPNAQLEITGKSSKDEYLLEVINNLGLTNHVFLKGSIPYSEVLDFLCSVNFLVIPSRIDNLPTVALEAFSVATPVIGSNSGGIPDIINHGYNGWLFESGNVDDLAEKINDLLINREKRDLMAKNARITFEEKYSISRLAQRFERFLEETTK
jgi:glycosyltransferase involved in cell wall biosynthesis